MLAHKEPVFLKKTGSYLLSFSADFLPEGFELEGVDFRGGACAHEATTGAGIVQGTYDVLEFQVGLFHDQVILFAFEAVSDAVIY
jgi:hypothetical protein